MLIIRPYMLFKKLFATSLYFIQTVLMYCKIYLATKNMFLSLYLLEGKISTRPEITFGDDGNYFTRSFVAKRFLQ